MNGLTLPSVVCGLLALSVAGCANHAYPAPPPVVPSKLPGILTVTVQPDPTCAPYTAGTVESKPAGIACTMTAGTAVTCQAPFDHSQTVSLYAGTNQPDDRFMRYSGACTGSNPVCNVAVERNPSVVATFCALIR